MFQAYWMYIQLWTACLLICLGLTLMLILRVPEGVTAQSRAILLRVCCVAGVVFLLCAAEWIYAVCLVAFMYTKLFRNWLIDPTDRALRAACWWLLLGGCLGLVDALNWLPVIVRSSLRPLKHPTLSIGLILGVLAVLAWNGLKRRRTTA